jgi:hypothetical protein
VWIAAARLQAVILMAAMDEVQALRGAVRICACQTLTRSAKLLIVDEVRFLLG